MKRFWFTLVAVLAVAMLLVVGCAPPAAEPDSGDGQPAPGDEEDGEDGTPSQPEGEVITWTVQSTYAEASPESVRLKEFFEERMPRLTGGRFHGQVFGPGAIVPAYEGWEGVEDGTLDACLITPADERGKFGPVGDLFNQYAAGPTGREIAAWFYEGDGMDLLQQTIQRTGFSNITPLGPLNLPWAEDELWSKVPIETLDDYDGLKIRTFGYWGQILEDLGASVVTLPGNEVYPALERGVIDATELGSPSQNRPLAIHEVCTYCYNPGVHSPGNCHSLQANTESWEALPDDVKYVMQRELKATAWESYSANCIADAEARQFFRDYGSQLIELPMDIQAYLVVKAAELWEDFAAEDDWFATVYENQLAFLNVYRGIASETEPNIARIRQYAIDNNIT